MKGTLARVWSNVTAPGPPPPGVVRFTAIALGGTLLLIGVLIALGIRDHGKASWHFHEARAGTYSSAALLITSAALAFHVSRRLPAGRLVGFWRVTAVGFLFLAYDELGVFHEDVDRWLHAQLGWRSDHPVTKRLDDALVALYGVIALAWGVRYRDALLRLRWATCLLVMGFVGFVGTTTLDVLNVSTTVEESVKVLAEALIVSGIYAAARDPGVYFSGL